MRVDHDIPIPERSSEVIGRLSQVFAQMNPGDSVEVEAKYSAIWLSASKAMGKKRFVIRSVDGSKIAFANKFRVWRLAA